MGAVNMMAVDEYQEAEERFTFLSTQRQDLLDSIRDTTQAIDEIDSRVPAAVQRSVRSDQLRFQRSVREPVRRRAWRAETRWKERRKRMPASRSWRSRPERSCRTCCCCRAAKKR